MDSAYGQKYRDLYETHWWWRCREQVILAELHRLRPSQSWGRILDVGCGDGLFFPRLSELGEVEGVEPDETLVTAHPAAVPPIYRVAFDDHFQPGKQYGLILMLDVLEHLDEPAKALSRAQQLLKPQGILLLTVPAFQSLWTQHDVLNQHRTRYTIKSFTSMAKGSGLTVLDQRYFFSWLFAAKLAQRGLEKLLKSKPVPPSVPPAWLNRSLERISLLEYRILRLLHPPIGSSLLIIAKQP